MGTAGTRTPAAPAAPGVSTRTPAATTATELRTRERILHVNTARTTVVDRRCPHHSGRSAPLLEARFLHSPRGAAPAGRPPAPAGCPRDTAPPASGQVRAGDDEPRAGELR